MDTPKILVVDDDEIVSRSFNRVLSDKGYQVSTAEDGKMAIDKFGSESYDLVFTDIKMPGMDGLEVTKRLKEMNPWIPVVIVTGYGSEDDMTRAANMGVSEFLHKPVAPDVIEGVAEKVLQRNKDEGNPPQKGNPAKNIMLFFAAPLIGLAYLTLFPFIGFAILVRQGIKTVRMLCRSLPENSHPHAHEQ